MDTWKGLLMLAAHHYRHGTRHLRRRRRWNRKAGVLGGVIGGGLRRKAYQLILGYLPSQKNLHGPYLK